MSRVQDPVVLGENQRDDKQNYVIKLSPIKNTLNSFMCGTDVGDLHYRVYGLSKEIILWCWSTILSSAAM